MATDGTYGFVFTVHGLTRIAKIYLSRIAKSRIAKSAKSTFSERNTESALKRAQERLVLRTGSIPTGSKTALDRTCVSDSFLVQTRIHQTADGAHSLEISIF